MKEIKPYLPTQQFLTESQYRKFCEKFYREIKPEIDRNQKRRIKSIESSLFHLVD